MSRISRIIKKEIGDKKTLSNIRKENRGKRRRRGKKKEKVKKKEEKVEEENQTKEEEKRPQEGRREKLTFLSIRSTMPSSEVSVISSRRTAC